MFETLLPFALSLLAPLALVLPAAAPEPAAFRPLAREVLNWRAESTQNLDLPLLSAVALVASQEQNPALKALRDAAGDGRLNVARCVKMNNYWCIKRAGWAGEIAADAEGHVAFASAAEGAVVAAGLLKRYYVDYKRISAMSIVSRWAPAQCGGFSIAAPRGGRVNTVLAPRGIANTLRGRWLATVRKSAIRSARYRRSVIKDHYVALARAPAIAVGLGETVVRLPTVSLSIALSAVPLREPAFAGGSCVSEATRIRNYARAASAGVAADENADLKLFDNDGQPTPNLARVMLNMSAVEIGPLHPREDLVNAAVQALALRLAQGKAAETPVPRQ